MNSSAPALKKNPLIGFIGIILVFLLFVSVTASLYTYILNFVIFSEDHYASIEITNEYIDKMKAYIEDELDTTTGRYSLPYEVVSGLLSDDIINDISKDMIVNVYKSLLNGSEHEEIVYDISAYKEAISAYIKTLPESHILNDPAIYEPMFTRLEEAITYSLDPIPLAQIKKFVPEISSVMQTGDMVGNAFWIFVVLSGVFIILYLFLNRKNFSLALYCISACLFCSATVYFVPAILISGYDVPARLALVSASPLRTVISTVWYSITDSMVSSALVFFIFSCVLGLISIILITSHKIKTEAASAALSESPANDASVSENNIETASAKVGRKRSPKRSIEPISVNNKSTEDNAADTAHTE